MDLARREVICEVLGWVDAWMNEGWMDEWRGRTAKGAPEHHVVGIEHVFAPGRLQGTAVYGQRVIYVRVDVRNSSVLARQAQLAGYVCMRSNSTPSSSAKILLSFFLSFCLYAHRHQSVASQVG